MELSTDESCMVVANACKNQQGQEFMRIMAINIGDDGKMSSLCHKDFETKEFCSVQFMRKVKGYDIFVLASKGSLVVIELKNKDSLSIGGKSTRNSQRSIGSESTSYRREFFVLNFYENLYSSYIYEVAIFNDLMVPVALGGKDESLKIIKLNIQSSSDQQDNNALMGSSRRVHVDASTDRSSKGGQIASQIYKQGMRQINDASSLGIKTEFIPTQPQGRYIFLNYF